MTVMLSFKLENGEAVLRKNNPSKKQMDATLTSHIDSIITLNERKYEIVSTNTHIGTAKLLGTKEPLEEMEFIVRLLKKEST